MAFSWQRGVNAGIGTTGAGGYVFLPMALYAPDNNLTLRRMIVTWLVDLQAGTDEFPYPSNAKLTYGITSTTGSTDTPPNPTIYPQTDPNADWVWWGGSDWQSFLQQPSGGETYYFNGTGNIDMQVNHSMSQTEYTRWWLVIEVNDSDSLITGWEGCAFWQALTNTAGV